MKVIKRKVRHRIYEHKSRGSEKLRTREQEWPTACTTLNLSLVLHTPKLILICQSENVSASDEGSTYKTCVRVQTCCADRREN